MPKDNEKDNAFMGWMQEYMKGDHHLMNPFVDTAIRGGLKMFQDDKPEYPDSKALAYDDAPVVPTDSPIDLVPWSEAGSLAAKGVRSAARAAAPRAGALLADEAGVFNLGKAVRKEVPNRALPMDEASRMARAKEMGFDPSKTYYHGTKAEIDAFDPNALGASTNAGSAKQGYFFASDPSTAADYADLSPGRLALRTSAESSRAMGEYDAFYEAMQKKYGATEMNFGKGPVTSWKDKASPEELAKYQGHVDKFAEIAKQRAPIEGLNPKLSLIDKEIAEKRVTSLQSKIESLQQAIQRRSQGAAQGDRTAGELVKEYQRDIERIRSSALPEAQAAAVKAARDYAQVEHLQNSGSNVLPTHLKTQNPYIHDFKGEHYRDMKYADIMKLAKERGHDSVIFKNTYDPADPENKVMQDIVAVFEPNQIRSKFAAFDPKKAGSGNLSAGIGGAAVGGGLMAGSDEASADERALNDIIEDGYKPRSRK